MRRKTAGIGVLLAAFGAVAQAQALPDLTVASHRRNGDAIEAVVANLGRAAAGVRTTATLFVEVGGRNVTVDQTVPALAAGDKVTLTFTLPVGTDADDIYQVMVDSRRELTEGSETNNRTLNARVGGAGTERPTGRGTAGTPDSALARRLAQYPPQVAEDGAPQPLAAARTPSGVETVFVEDQLVLSTKDPSVASAVAARWGGKIVQVTDWGPGSALGATYLLRVRTTRTASIDLTPQERQTVFSSAAAHNLLTIAKAENAKGLRLGVNLIADPTSIPEGKTLEGGGNDGLSLDYLQAGGTYNVDVATAWKMLLVAGKLEKTVLLGILDNGFGVGRSDFIERDIDVAASSEASGPNTEPCSGGTLCPWHGLGSAEAAAGIPDDGHGATGPAGPVARLLLWDKGHGLCAAMNRLKALRDAGAQIINMSFTGEVERDRHLFEGAWINELDDFEGVTRDMAFKENRLLFAAAGNEDQNVDAKNGDGDEVSWHWPCENQGVVCVGGWYDLFNGEGPYGKGPAMQSNYSFQPSGETVDIYGPWCATVGDNPGNSGKDVLQTPCGTSLASPVVAGVAALIWAAHPGLSAQQVWGLMSKHAISAGTIRRVHASGAVREALMMSGVNVPPTVKLTAQVAGTFSPGSSLALTQEDFDVEDAQSCCAARWFVDDTQVFSLSPNDSALLKMTQVSLGTHTLKVTVTDSQGASASASAPFTVKNAPPKVKVTPMASEMFVGLPYEFRAEVSDELITVTAGAEECAQVAWSAAAGDMTPSQPTGCSVFLTFGTPGAHQVTASYADPQGEKASASASFFVKGGGSSFGISITSPRADDGFTSEQPIVYTTKVVNATGVVFYAWTLTDLETKETKPLPLVLGANPSFKLKSIFPALVEMTAGRTYRLTVTAKDRTTGQTASASVEIHQQGFIK